MRILYLTLASLLFIGQVFSQTQTDKPHGKAAKGPAQKAVKNVDPKVMEVVKEIEDQMVKVEGGNFTMGCANPNDSACYYWEKPRHTVTLTTFYMGKFPVSEKQWKILMGNSPFYKYCADCPAYNISWFDAQVFINKLNQLSGKAYRLPTEAEWEYAAKGGNKSHGYTYSGSNDASEVAWYDTLITHEIKPVGQKKANELGIYDLSGNVWQWCSDWFDDKYYTKSPSTNPQGPATGDGNRVLRGGSWWGPMRDCRVANRDKYPPDSKDDDVGFRIVRN